MTASCGYEHFLIKENCYDTKFVYPTPSEMCISIRHKINTFGVIKYKRSEKVSTTIYIYGNFKRHYIFFSFIRNKYMFTLSLICSNNQIFCYCVAALLVHWRLVLFSLVHCAYFRTSYPLWNHAQDLVPIFYAIWNIKHINETDVYLTCPFCPVKLIVHCVCVCMK